MVLVTGGPSAFRTFDLSASNGRCLVPKLWRILEIHFVSEADVFLALVSDKYC